MAQVPRDNNQVTAILGSNSGVAFPIKVDHTTGYIKLGVYGGTLNVPSVSPTDAPRDQNQTTAMLGTYNGSLKTLFVDHATGYLKVIIS